MKYLIASDLHGNLKAARALAEAFSREGADRLILLGDLLEHGYPESRSRKEMIGLLNGFKNCTLAVRGNCDSDADAEVLAFELFDPVLLFKDKASGLTIAATHGNRFDDACPPPFLPAGSLLLCGHTHIPAYRNCGDFLYVNPGSAGQPRCGSAPGCVILENDVLIWKDLAGNVLREQKI